MKIQNTMFAILCLAVAVGSMTGCASLQSQMGSYDREIRSCMEDGRWNAASRVITHAQFDCEPHEMGEVEAWRNREHVCLKLVFAKSLVPMVAEANAHYSKGDILAGDKIRQKMKDRYFGGNYEMDKGREGVFESLMLHDADREVGLPEELVQCFDLAQNNMLSDRTVARMIRAYNGLTNRINAIDVKGRKKSVEELNSIDEGFKEIDKWKDEIDLFMGKLADPEISRWAYTDKSTYAQSIGKMEAVRRKVRDAYEIKHWNTRVLDRKAEYKSIIGMIEDGKYEQAMQMLQKHDPLFRPVGLAECVDFDDSAERARAASGELSIYMVKKLFSDPQDVHIRYAPRNGVLSALIVGRTIVDDLLNKKELREAVRVARLQAESAFARHRNTEVFDKKMQEGCEDDERSHSSFSSETQSRAQAEVSNFVLLAKGIHNDEVVVIMGWRNPCLGNVTGSIPRSVAGEQNLDVSSSFGAYL